jgi:hypothetical protein
VAGGLITDELLEWPPDLSALANILERAEAFRFAFAPVGEWPPAPNPRLGPGGRRDGPPMERLG